MEQLTIRNFAGIRHLDLEVRPFTVLIGPQSVGKSVTAKLLYFFQNIPRYLSEDLSTSPASVYDTLANNFGRLFPVSQNLDDSCTITYEAGSSVVKVNFVDDPVVDWSINFPEGLEESRQALFERLDEARATSDSADLPGRSIAEDEAFFDYQEELARVFPENRRAGLFIPAGRSFYAQVQASMASFFSQASLDPFTTDFGITLDRMKKQLSPTRKARLSDNISRMPSELLLGGQFLREADEDYIRTTDGRRLPAKLWSSGQQEAQPLVFVLQHYCGVIAARPLFIEEPEAHLFPASQRTMTELIALAFRKGHPASRMFLTTHSPYILTTINNLLLAGQIHTADNPTETKARLSNLVPADHALSPGSVGAFYMDQNGCRSIIDEETGLIEADAIDEVSGDLNETFEKLLDLQYHP